MITGEIDVDVEVNIPGASLSNAAKNNERQYGVIYDLLCAGPLMVLLEACLEFI